MPLRHKSAQKRARQTVKKTERNKKYKALIKGSVKRVMVKEVKAEAETEFKKTTAVLDRAAVKGIIHKNKAANQKSKLAKHINKLVK
ncbi:MAG TPA: 30S ribosomal protein S20 [Ignavibacteria bacterium]|nr:30S ribosomal protein S20 [Bacteroidota bacterium]HRI84149.1 30S ribosomal protein S20 [Ignavibacteria bacterium]HRJ98815.1 30S ribosomal protein S20 [Ignavibacteria bacterium]